MFTRAPRIAVALFHHLQASSAFRLSLLNKLSVTAVVFGTTTPN